MNFVWIVTLCATSDVFLYHARKAGGTSLRHWLKQANIEHTVMEGYNLDRVKNETWITSIRDPVERLWSSFKYEGRWELKKHLFNNSGVPFNKWHEKTSSLICRRKTWQCSRNCFTRWFSGCVAGKIENAWEAAVANLKKFDIIINTSKLKHKTYHEKVMACLNTTTPIKHKLPWMGRQAAIANKRWPLIRPDLTAIAKENALDYTLLAPYWDKDPC